MRSIQTNLQCWHLVDICGVILIAEDNYHRLQTFIISIEQVWEWSHNNFHRNQHKLVHLNVTKLVHLNVTKFRLQIIIFLIPGLEEQKLPQGIILEFLRNALKGLNLHAEWICQIPLIVLIIIILINAIKCGADILCIFWNNEQSVVEINEKITFPPNFLSDIKLFTHSWKNMKYKYLHRHCQPFPLTGC